MSRQMIFKWKNYVILVIFYGYFTFGLFWQWRRPFLVTSLNTIYVDNNQGVLEHVSDFLYLKRFRRYLIETLSGTFENRLFKLLKTWSKCIKLPGLFGWLNFARNLFSIWQHWSWNKSCSFRSYLCPAQKLDKFHHFWQCFWVLHCQK